MARVKIAVVGAGRFANTAHYPSLAQVQDVELVAISDLDERRLAETAGKYAIAGRFQDYRQMLSDAKPDAVYVLMPPAAMLPVALDILARGIPVFTEKPPGMNVGEAQALADAARRAGTFGMVGFNRCYNPAIVEAKRRIENLGAITLVVAEFHKPPHPTYQSYGSHIVADVIHSIALLHFLGGSPRTLQVNNRSVGEEGVVDLTTALLEFESGAAGVLISNFTSGPRYERFEIHTTGAGAYIMAPDTRLGAYPKAPTKVDLYAEGRPPESIDGFEIAGSNEMHRAFGYYDESLHFIECVKSARTPITSFDFGVGVMRTAIEIESRAARTAHPGSGT